MFDWLAPFIAAVRNAGQPIYGAVFIATLLLLFLPDWMLGYLGLGDFRHSNRAYIGLALLASASLLCVQVIGAISHPWRAKRAEARFNRTALEALRELTDDEKRFIRPFMDGENTQYARISDGVPKGLEAKTIVYRAANISMPGGSFPYNLQPYARRLLNDHPELLE